MGVDLIVNRRFFSRKTPVLSFRELNLMEEICQVLEKHHIRAPSSIQSLAIPELLKGKSALLTAQTGTGKTLAYATPIIHMLKMQELQAQIRLTVPHRPRTIVIVPNRELAQQAEEVFRMFMYDVPLRFYAAFAGTKLSTEFKKIQEGIDCLITTPDRLVRHRDAKKIFLSNCSSVVIDECDTLLDAGMGDFITNLITPLVKTPNSQEMQYVHEKKVDHSTQRQIVFCSATITKQMESLVSKFWIPGDKKFVHLVEKNTHMNLTNLDHEFIKLSERDKYEPLRHVLKEFQSFIRTENTAGMIFCNSIQSARSAEHTLRSFGFKVSSLHGDIPPMMRNKYVADFRNRKTDLLVATDLGSRGLDFPFVSHVFNLDFPKTVSDYIHRAGRAGRAGKEGYVKSFYRKFDEPIIDQMRRSHEDSIPMKIGGSSFTYRKTFERPVVGGKIKPLPVSQPGRRKSRSDPLAATSNLLIKTYDNPTETQPKKRRVAHYQRKSRNAGRPERESIVKIEKENKKLGKKVSISQRRKNRNYIPRSRKF
ncbi:unnamed protein product [Moneuplotes crassus]|uniref:RNA helicase n=1 Tax=Euplotes crassus TaxID=5936 RepID=A0AAD1XBF5_EUPCR|nr:unnamed protein product [Moneuplotes crassus]